MPYARHFPAELALQSERHQPDVDQYLRRPREQPAGAQRRQRSSRSVNARSPLHPRHGAWTDRTGGTPSRSRSKPSRTIRFRPVTQASERLVRHGGGVQQVDLEFRAVPTRRLELQQEPCDGRGAVIEAPPQPPCQSFDRSGRPLSAPIPRPGRGRPPIASTTMTGSAELAQSSRAARSSARPVNGALPTYGGTAWKTGALRCPPHGPSSRICLVAFPPAAQIKIHPAERDQQVLAEAATSAQRFTVCRDLTRD